jgi:hypothetical protein
VLDVNEVWTSVNEDLIEEERKLRMSEGRQEAPGWLHQACARCPHTDAARLFPVIEPGSLSAPAKKYCNLVPSLSLSSCECLGM